MTEVDIREMPEAAQTSKVGLIAALLVMTTAFVFLFFKAPPDRPNLDFAGYGYGFDGDAKLPRETIQSALQAARDSMKSQVGTSRTMRTAQMILQWVSFLFGAIVTVVAGYHWQSNTNESKLEDLKKAFGRKAKSLRFVGVVSALATVLTVAAAKFGETSSTFYDRAKETQAKLNSAVADIQKARSAEETQAVLDDLTVRR